MRPVTRFLFVGAALAAVMFAGLPTATGLDQGSLGAVGPAHPVIQKKFGPLAGDYPTPNNPRGHPFVGYRPNTCRKVTYCDAFTLDVKFPKSFEQSRTEFWGVSVTLDWQNARTKSNATGNDVDLFLWPDDDPALGGPVSSCKSPKSPACENLKSETVNLTEPDDTTRLDPPTPLYFSVVNDTGVNTGYTLTAKWYTFALPAGPNFKQPATGGATTQSQGTVTGPFDAYVTPSKDSTGITGPEPTPRKILVPGPDGTMHEVELPTYAAGTKFTAADTKPRSPWVLAFIVGGLVLVLLSAYLIARARRQDREASAI